MSDELGVPESELERMEAIVTSEAASLEPDELKAWRAKLKLTQAAFAAALRGLGHSTATRTVRYWESGDRGTPPWLALLRTSNPRLEQPPDRLRPDRPGRGEGPSD